jgi:CHAT domain-containing protein
VQLPKPAFAALIFVLAVQVGDGGAKSLDGDGDGDGASQPAALAAALNRQALGDVAERRFDAAVDGFLDAAGLAAGSESDHAIRSRLNATRAMIAAGRTPEAIHELAGITLDLDAKSDAPALFRLAAADLYRSLVNELGASADFRLDALAQINAARDGLSDDDRALKSWANGYAGALYEDEQRFEEALVLTRLAAGDARSAALEAGVFRWEWQQGRILRELGRQDDALAAYARAAEALGRQRSALQDSQENFDRIFRPFYYQYADLLLREATAAVDVAARQALLSRAQEALEAVKAAEIEDYFQEQCVVENSTPLDSVPARTAFLYPVLLDDRVELIVTAASGDLTNVSVPVRRLDVVAAVRDLRLNLEVYTATSDYLRLGQQLYGWLIEPVEPLLTSHDVETLVVIPDGPLRTIPLAALHDGSGFLVERFAVATAPGLSLMTAPHERAGDRQVFAGGISESVQGFAALPSVVDELAALESRLSARVLKNAAFTTQALSNELAVGDYAIVHLATHGKFGGSYADSFLVTYDDRLQIDELADVLAQRRSRRGVLDLLVLSACETAAGDDRAALGLAGVAIKSGARSAMASLWEVDDEATRRLVDAFYANLSAVPGASKARSLQMAQRALLGEDGFAHPSNWAPFLIIGDWL